MKYTKSGDIVNGQTVTAVIDCPYWDAPLGRKAKILKSFWRVGEPVLKLQDIKTGEKFESPVGFWK